MYVSQGLTPPERRLSLNKRREYEKTKLTNVADTLRRPQITTIKICGGNNQDGGLARGVIEQIAF